MCILVSEKGEDVRQGPFEEMHRMMRLYQGMARVVRASDRVELATASPWSGYPFDRKRKFEAFAPLAEGVVLGTVG